MARYLEENADILIKDKTVLELGAGAGLPSLVCAFNGARSVVITDYPDPDLIKNLEHNIEHSHVDKASNTVAKGYLWGNPVEELIALLPRGSAGFDLLILADVVFNHSEHAKLIRSIAAGLSASPGARALIFFTPYRPWLFEKDMALFDLAKQEGFMVKKLMEKTLDRAMFENDPGDEKLRRTVFGYQLMRSTEG